MRSVSLHHTYTIVLIGLFCIALIYAPTLAHAQVTYTQPLTNIPGITDEATLKSVTEVGLIGFINGIVRFIIQASAIASVVMIVITGFKYLFAENSAAGIKKLWEDIQGLLLGIGLIAGTWIILNTVNPNITTNLNVFSNRKQVASTTTQTQSGVQAFDAKRKDFSTLTDKDARFHATTYADSIKSANCTPQIDPPRSAGGGRGGDPAYIVYTVYCQAPN